MFPKVLRTQNFKMIEQELKNYYATKNEVKRIETQIKQFIEDIAYPESGIKTEFVTHKAIIDGREIEIKTYSPVIPGRGGISDPTSEKAIKAYLYWQQTKNSLVMLEIERRIKAIEYTIWLLHETDYPDGKAKYKFLKEKYFEKRLSERQLLEEIGISRTTAWRWKKEIVGIVAQRLGWVI